MKQIQVKLLNPEGMHARPAGVLVKVISQFQSKVEIEMNGVKKNAKSLINILSFGLKHNDEITLTIDGPDADSVSAKLADLFARSIES